MDNTPRLTIPENGNPYYNNKKNGGYNKCITAGNYKVDGCNVLPNCTGYASGRFHEILRDKTFKYLCPFNAELFYDYAVKQGLRISEFPEFGSVACWQKGSVRDRSGSDGAGHVEVVEIVYSKTECLTSASGWGDKRIFWTKKRKRGNGNWGMSGDYKFLGFICLPNTQIIGDKTTQKQSACYSIPNYKGNSIVDALRLINAPYSFNDRKSIAIKNGITNYSGTAQENKKLLSLLLDGKLLKL